MIALLILLLIATILLFTTNPHLLKIAATSHFISTVYIFVLMIWAFPSTIVLTPRDAAMVIATLCMLANTVVLLLLWNQLETSRSHMLIKNKGTVLIILGILIVILATVLVSTPRRETAVLHSRNGFTLQYPKTWLADTSMKEAPAEFIREPDDKASFSIQSHNDSRITNPSKLPSVYKDIQTAFVDNPHYQILKEEWENADKTIAENSYFVSGIYTENEKQWRFKEITILAKGGTVLVLRGMSRIEYGDSYWSALDGIFSSVQSTKDWAMAEVRALPEVRDFETMLAKTGKVAVFEIEGENSNWAVHVFEVVKNDDGTSHTTTFGWYRVNEKAGAVEKEI